MSARTAARGGPSRPGLLRGATVEVAAAALLLLALGLFHVWSRTRVVAAGYALGELQKEHAALLASRDQLRIELEFLKSPAELERAVRTKLSKLGMAPPDRGAVLAAGPARPLDAPGRAGVDGVGHPPRPAEPALSNGSDEDPRRAAAGPAAASAPLTLDLSRGERRRGPLRAGRLPARSD